MFIPAVVAVVVVGLVAAVAAAVLVAGLRVLVGL
jgi:hypothetical protein